MPEIRLKIKGVHYAVHPDYNPKNGDVSTEEMELETIERLRELDERRPKVILVPEPLNPVDPKAVRAWCEGNPIGRVDADQTSEAHCLFNDSCRMTVVQIDSVEVQQRGNFFVKAEVSDEALSRKPSIFEKISSIINSNTRQDSQASGTGNLGISHLHPFQLSFVSKMEDFLDNASSDNSAFTKKLPRC